MLWGLSWTFASGADVAWLTDELDRPAGVAPVLARAARAQLTGAAVGMVAAGALAWATQRGTTMVAAGAAMLLLGLYVALRFREERFVPTQTRRRSAARGILTRGLALVRHRRALVVIFGATFLVNGAADAAGRLYPKQLLDRGFPAEPDPVVGFAVLGVLALLVGAAALRLVERRLGGNADRRDYVLAATAGAAGLLLLAGAPDAVSGSAAVLLFAGIANPLTRTIGTIWVNARTSGDVRATVHSFLAQAEYLGEITCGLAIAAIAHRAGLPAALAGGAVLFALAAGLMLAAPPDHDPPDHP
jgi:hypothetical protein